MSTLISKSFVAGSFFCSIVLTGCVSQGQYDLVEARNTQLEQQVAEQSRQHAEAQSQIAAHQVQITRLQGAIKYTIESDLLFPPGSWTISDDGKEIIAKMAKKLAPSQEGKLVVNGYTDNTPIGPSLEKKGVTSNKELSEKRAEAVKELLISEGIPADKLKAVGHGQSHPVAKNDTATGRSHNRRVELTQLGG